MGPQDLANMAINLLNQLDLTANNIPEVNDTYLRFADPNFEDHRPGQRNMRKIFCICINQHFTYKSIYSINVL